MRDERENHTATCEGPDNCKFVEQKQSSGFVKFITSNWVILIVYVFTFGAMVQQNKTSNAAIPAIEGRTIELEKNQLAMAQLQQQSLDLVKQLNEEFNLYKERAIAEAATAAEALKRNDEEIRNLRRSIEGRRGSN
jgi:BMFP domain-containing protein YqiC